MVNTVSAQEFKLLAESGKPLDVIDVRTPSEFESVHINIALNHPLDQLKPLAIQAARNGSAQEPLYIVCRSGARGQKACEQFIATGIQNVVNIAGGTMACESAGVQVVKGRKSISIPSQVQIIVGSIVVAGSVLAAYHPLWAMLTAVMGAGLLYSGVTDSCVMGMMLARMPWNQTRPQESA